MLQPIGEGGTAVVHLAVGPGDRMVAVKMLRRPEAADADARSRLAREVSAMRRVRSPFVAEVIDADPTGNVPYLVTTLVAGPTLAQVVAQQGPLSGSDLQRVAYGLAEGLAAVHAAGIVHRDLKPRNVMMADGDPVLIDFGIANQAGDVPLTQTGTFIGTPGYLAPEVINGRRAEAPADVHAWGTTVGFAARGEPLYGTGAYELVFCRILRAEADLDGIHGRLYPLIAAALLREPCQRPTAAWLASQMAGLDLAAPENVPTIVPLDLDTATRPLPKGSPDPVRQPDPSQRPAELADLLPAVRYVAARRPISADRTARTTGEQHRHPLLALVALAMAVSASFVLPVVGTFAVAVLLTVLRACNRARVGVVGRRKARGPRAWDSLLVVSSIPWALSRSAIETVLLAPLLLAAAGVAVTAWTILFHGTHVMSVWAAAAAAYTALSCLGPRSRSARRELSRVLSSVTSSPLAAAVAMLTAGVLAMIVAGLVLIQTPPMWPLPDPPNVSIHVSGFNPGLLHG
ncbi:MAG: serine/threonine-protein kinase [Streptosporangiaceae bacterium]